MNTSRAVKLANFSTYFSAVAGLLKLRLGFSIVITILPALFVGDALPSLSLVIITLSGTWMMASASFAYNQIVERNSDAKMKRTESRPLVAGTISLVSAHIVASLFLGVGLYLLLIGPGPLAALLALFSLLYYIFIYTLLLKPRTALNTLIGGVSGSIGPLIGEAAVRGSIGPYGIMMFLLLFLWQPPHFWSLGLHYRNDYKRADFPILPVVRDKSSTVQQMIFYYLLLLLVMLLIWFLELAGVIFFLPSFALGLIVLYCMIRLKGDKFPPLKLFYMTILHVVVWHVALAIDLYLRFWAA